MLRRSEHIYVHSFAQTVLTLEYTPGSTVSIWPRLVESMLFITTTLFHSPAHLIKIPAPSDFENGYQRDVLCRGFSRSSFQV